MEDDERRRLGGNPDWMSRLPGELLDVPLWNLALPGNTEILESGEMGYHGKIIEPTHKVDSQR